MTVLKFCMLATAGLSAAMVIKQWKNDFLPLLRIGLSLLFAAAAVTQAAPAVAYIKALAEHSAIAPYTEILFKSLGIAVLTGTCAAVCRESGESGIAEGVELIGKAELLLLSLPLIEELLTAAASLLSMGG